ncbi:hypothetical protein BC830DRAFT_1156051 [Chytriomyces sp. MP71]|nr:hypothetical protein BC830DRAFT_1156051 [Chytriomyces sp. MP71]
MQPASGRQGVFPLVCVCSLAEAQSAKHGGGAITAARLSKRMSSASSVLSLTMSSHQTATQSPGPMPQQQFEKVYVLFGYDATQDDELTLVPGKEVLLLRRFDDGWGLAMSPITAKKGAIPLVCVGTKEQLTASLIGDRASVMTGISKRASSYLQVQ